MRLSNEMSTTKRKKTAANAPPASIQVTIRLDPAVLEDADEMIPMLTEKTGLPATRVEVLRTALLRGLRDMKRESQRASA